MLKSSFYLIVLLLVSSGSQAQGLATSFVQQAAQFASHCAADVCSGVYSKKTIYDLKKSHRMNYRKLRIFGIIAKKQAQVWGDTILEGDYVADGLTRIDSVSELKIQNKLMGYLLTYSEGAWNTTNCLYDGRDDSTLKDCLAGRIIESSYVSPDYKEYFYDDTTSATFK